MTIPINPASELVPMPEASRFFSTPDPSGPPRSSQRNPQKRKLQNDPTEPPKSSLNGENRRLNGASKQRYPKIRHRRGTILEAYTEYRLEMQRFLLVLFGVLSLIAPARAESSPDFSRDIQPIFQKRCYVCHGPQVQMKGLRFDDRQAALRAIQPGDSSHSRLIAMATGVGGKFMPPTGPRLSAAEVALLRAWKLSESNRRPWPIALPSSGA